LVWIYFRTGTSIMSNFTKLMAQAAAGAAGGGDFYPYTVDNSVRFNGSDNAYLAKTFSTTPTSRTTCTDSVWVKLTGRRNGSNTNTLFGSGGNWEALTFIEPGNVNGWPADQIRSTGMTSTQPTLRTTSLYRDYGGWFHVMRVWDSTNATAADRHRLYINGVRLTDFDQQVNASLNQQLVEWLSTSGATNIGISGGATSQTFEGYMAEVVVLDGTAASPTDLGQLKNGVWIPKNPSGLAFGNNGFYLDFSNSSALGTDVSGNGNNFTTSGLTSSDQMIDTPTNNFATLSPLYGAWSNGGTLYNGNLGFYTSGTQTYPSAHSTMAFPLEGGYAEARVLQKVYQYYAGTFGIISTDLTHAIYLSTDGNLEQSGQSNIAATAWGAGSYIGIAYNPSTGVFKTWVNGGSEATTTCTKPELDYIVYAQGYTVGWHSMVMNFGQDSTFADAVSPGSYTDANGIGSFRFTQAQNYLALCTANQSEPTIGPNVAVKPYNVFDTVVYTGSGSTKTVSGLNFKPDFTWIKNRTDGATHLLFDAIRGASNFLASSDSDAESTVTSTLTSFDGSGFTVGANNAANGSGDDMVAWNWKGNGPGVSNTNGSITSTVSANTAAGFSIVTYTGSSSGISVGHGLSSAPEMIIWKARGTPNGIARSWVVWTKDLTSTDYIVYLDLTNAQTNVTAGTVLASSPTATTFSLGTEPSVNWNAENYVSYCFHSVKGFSSFGKYTGNGSADGPMIYTGFRPAFVMVKRTDSTASWLINDAKRDTYNLVTRGLFPNGTGAEATGYDSDFVSNGFKIRDTTTIMNASGGSYIYMAFAENPFKYANAR